MLALFSSFAFGVLARAEPAQEAGSAQKSKVLIGTDANFDALKKQHPRMMLKMKAPWCGHCKAFAPIYEEVAAKITDVAFVDINCEKNQDVCGRHGVEGYPTVKYYHDGALYTYNGERTADALETYLQTMREPQFPETTLDEMELQHDGKQFFVVYGNEASVQKYEPFLKRFKGELAFGFVRDQKERFVAVQENTEIPYTGKLVQQSINAFIAMHKMAFYPDLTDAYPRSQSGRICIAVVEPEVEMALEEQLKEIQTGNQEGEKYKFLEKLPIVRGDTSKNEKFYELFAEPPMEQYILMMHTQGRDYMYAKQEVHNAKDVLEACKKHKETLLVKAETPEDKEKRQKAEAEAAAKKAEDDVEATEKAERIKEERGEVKSVKINQTYIIAGVSAAAVLVVIFAFAMKGEKKEEQKHEISSANKGPKKGNANGKKAEHSKKGK